MGRERVQTSAGPEDPRRLALLACEHLLRHHATDDQTKATEEYRIAVALARAAFRTFRVFRKATPR